MSCERRLNGRDELSNLEVAHQTTAKTKEIDKNKLNFGIGVDKLTLSRVQSVLEMSKYSSALGWARKLFKFWK